MTSASTSDLATSCWSALKGGDLRLAIGAGASIDAGLPYWTELARRLAAWMRGKVAGACRMEPSWAIECIRGKASEVEYRRALRLALYGPGFALSPHTWPFLAIRHLAAIAAEIALLSPDAPCHVITYNLDCLLELSLQRLGLTAVAMVPVLGESRPYRILTFCPEEAPPRDRPVVRIVHPHGLVHIAEDQLTDERQLLAMPLTMSSEDYEIRGGVADVWQNSQQIAAFSQHRCLFYGFGFADPSVRRLLRLAAQIRGTSTRSKRDSGHMTMLLTLAAGDVPSEQEIEARLADLGFSHVSWTLSQSFQDQVGVLHSLSERCRWGGLDHAMNCR